MRKAAEAPQIGEMMLAKTVLQEKNEQLEAKDRQLRQLATRLKVLTDEVERLRSERGPDPPAGPAAGCRTYQDGVAAVVEGVIGVLADWGPEQPGLTARLLALLRERHGLEMIEQVPGRLEPRLHRVVEVCSEQGAGVEVLARGYRLGTRILRPALVRAGRP